MRRCNAERNLANLTAWATIEKRPSLPDQFVALWLIVPRPAYFSVICGPRRASPRLPVVRQALYLTFWLCFERLVYLTALTFSHFRLCPEASTASHTYCVWSASLNVGLAGLPVATPSRKSAS